MVISKSSDSIEGVWYPKEKIRQAKKKLQGYNPAHVMLTELTLGHEKTAEYPALKIILMGDKKYSKRAQVSLVMTRSSSTMRQEIFVQKKCSHLFLLWLYSIYP